MVGYIRFRRFAKSPLPPRDTPLHHCFPFLTWTIMASLIGLLLFRGERKRQAQLEEFNKEYQPQESVWVRGNALGFELHYSSKGLPRKSGNRWGLLGGTAYSPVGETQRDCYLSSIHTIDSG